MGKWAGGQADRRPDGRTDGERERSDCSIKTGVMINISIAFSIDMCK